MASQKAERKRRTSEEADQPICWLAVEDPLMRQSPYLDKQVNELAEGKPMEKIRRRPA